MQLTAKAWHTIRHPSLRSLVGAFLALPALAWVILFFAFPILRMAQISLYRHVPGGGIDPSYTLRNYVRFLGDSYYWGILVDTLLLGAGVTVLCLILGFPAAYALSRLRGRLKSLLYVLVVLPLVTGLVTRIIGWLILLGRNGIVNSLLLATGLTTEPLRILFTPYASVIALVQVLLPFMILSVNSVLENLDPHLEEAAQGLGATPYRTLSNVVLPLSRPGLVSGSILVFVLTVSSYETPALLGGERHKVIAVTIQEQAMLLINWPFGAAISFSLLMALALVSVLYLRATRGGNGVK